MGLWAVLAHSHNVVAGLGEGGVVVSETAGLCRAAGCVVLRVEVYDGFLSDFTVLPSWSRTSNDGILSPIFNIAAIICSMFKDNAKYSYFCVDGI